MPQAILEFLRESKGKAVKPLDATERVWEITAHDVQEKLLQLICDKTPIVIIEYDEPPYDESALYVEPLGVTSYQIKKGAKSRLIMDWLILGNWQIFSPEVPTELLNLYRVPIDSIIRYADRNELGLLIDSYYDNDSWRVVIPHHSQYQP